MIQYKLSSDLYFSHKNSDIVVEPEIIKVIGDFDEDMDKKIIESCEKALKTGQKILPILIDSYGGYIYSLLGIMDYFDSLRDEGIEIITICTGKAMSAGAILFCLGDRRFIGKRSTLLFHRGKGGYRGNEDDLKVGAEELKRLGDLTHKEISLKLGKPANWLDSKMKELNYADWYVDPKTAKKEGIATDIGIPTFEVEVTTNFKIRS